MLNMNQYQYHIFDKNENFSIFPKCSPGPLLDKSPLRGRFAVERGLLIEEKLCVYYFGYGYIEYNNTSTSCILKMSAGSTKPSFNIALYRYIECCHQPDANFCPPCTTQQ